jgi:hypothetical protein
MHCDLSLRPRAQVRLQLFATLNPGVPKPNFVQLIAKMVRDEGIKSVYAGLSAALMRQAIYGTARIGLHRTFSDRLYAALVTLLYSPSLTYAVVVRR